MVSSSLKLHKCYEITAILKITTNLMIFKEIVAFANLVMVFWQLQWVQIYIYTK